MISVVHASELKNVIEMCIDHYPTDHMFPEELEETNQWSAKMEYPFGFAIESMKEISKRMNLKLVTTGNTPFKRCLFMMKAGKTDLIWGLLSNADRESYMHLMEYKGSTPKVFLVNKVTGIKLSRYEDLAGLRIGVVRGFSYFPRFDKEKELFKKYEVNTIQHGLHLLLVKRLDAFVLLETNLTDYVHPNEKFSETLLLSGYGYDVKHPVHIALSKKSKWANRHQELADIVLGMRKHGKFQKIRQDFNQWYYGDKSQVPPSDSIS